MSTTDATASPDPTAPVAAEAQPVVQTSEVQPVVEESPDPSQTSQGLIEPYLKDVDPLLRDKVAPILERFRSEQDARVNAKLEQNAQRIKAYEQYGDPERVATASLILDKFLEDPVGTTQWLIQQGMEEFGVDILSAINETAPAAEVEAAEPDPDQPLTQQAVLDLLKKMDADKQQAAQTEALQASQKQQAAQRALSWMDESVGRHALPESVLDDTLKQVMFTRANGLVQQGLANDGASAIDMAVAEMAAKFSQVTGKPAAASTDPKVANGGTAPPQAPFDVTDDKARREAMLDRLMSSSNI